MQPLRGRAGGAFQHSRGQRFPVRQAARGSRQKFRADRARWQRGEQTAAEGLPPRIERVGRIHMPETWILLRRHPESRPEDRASHALSLPS